MVFLFYFIWCVKTRMENKRQNNYAIILLFFVRYFVEHGIINLDLNSFESNRCYANQRRFYCNRNN